MITPKGSMGVREQACSAAHILPYTARERYHGAATVAASDDAATY
jgi:hypothetical protein